MTRRHIVILLGFAVVAASLAWLVEGRFKWVTPTGTLGDAGPNISGKAPATTGPIIYYRDPDGRPAYSSTPKKTSTGKDYLPVRASEDVSFEDKPPAGAAKRGGERRVRFYRHPMGLPDTSPVPKKDEMGMDYIPVYEDEAPWRRLWKPNDACERSNSKSLSSKSKSKPDTLSLNVWREALYDSPSHRYSFGLCRRRGQPRLVGRGTFQMGHTYRNAGRRRA